MIRRMKSSLAHISPQSVRYRIVHRAFRDQQIRRAHACTFYWVFLPAAVFTYVTMPFVFALAWIISRPIAWLAGFRRINPFFPSHPDDMPEGIPPVYENAHVKLAPWRIVVPLAIIVAIIALHRFWIAETITGSGIAFGLIVGWIVFTYHARMGRAWDRICPRLEVDHGD